MSPVRFNRTKEGRFMLSNRLPRLVFTFACLAATAGAGIASAAPVRNRITQPISQAETTEIANSVNPKVKRSTDLGQVSPDTRLESLTLQFSMTAEQTAALDQLLSDLQNPASPQYHQWLTPAQYATQFGLSSADLATVKAWLNSQGFTINTVANGGQFISFSGTAAQAQTAFGTSIHNVSYDGETHYANVTNASIPVAIAAVVSGVAGLQNFRFKPRVHALRPAFTSSVSGNHYIAPGDAYTIYGSNALLNSGVNGTGVKIAVTGQVDINPADIAAFQTAAGLSTANVPTTVVANKDPGAARSCSSATSSNCPSPNQDDLAESSLDVEWSSAMAPGATILFVTGPDIMLDAMTQAVDQNLAPIITTSYGACEAGWGTTELSLLGSVFKQAAAQGQTVLAASADEGATDCDAGPSATQGLTVDFPASSPYVTGMGGTTFNDGTGTGATQYWSNTEGTTSNGGSALGYIPEAVWNDISAGGFGGSGGGASGYFTKPAWQTGKGVPNDGSRDVPDISLNASDTHDQFLYCVNVAAGSSCTNGFRKSDTTLTVAGGTSFDSQIFGGMLALVEQKIGGRIGNANPMLYALGNNSTYYVPGTTILTNSNVVFNDVTSGDNKMPCTAGTPNCPNAGGSIGYSATNGYDLATGWGSVNLTNLANAWAKVAPLGNGTNGTNASTTALTVSPGTVAAGATVTFTGTVAGSAGAPTGAVQFLVNGAVVGTGTLANGVATYTYTTSCANLAALSMPKLLPQQPAARPKSGRGVWYGAGSGTVVTCLLFVMLPRRRRLSNLYVALIAVAITAGLAGCSGGGTVANPSTTTTTTTTTPSTTNGHLVITASYSGSSTYAGSIASGLTTAGFTTTTSTVSPILVTVTPGGC
jgi:subtilase family serine protease